MYEDDSNKVWVIRRNIDKVRLRDDVLAGLFANDDAAAARTVSISARAARAIRFLTERETLFNVKEAEAALVRVLANRDISVQIPACGALGCMKSASAVPVIREILMEGDSRPTELRVAGYRALGDVLEDTGSIDPQTERVLEMGENHDDIVIVKEAARARAKMAGVRTSPAILSIEK